MRYFDAVEIKEGVDPALVSRLGFKKMLILGKDISIQERPGQQGKKYILKSRDTGSLMKALRDRSAVGIMFEDNEIDGKVIAAAREAEKPVVINLSGIFSREKGERYRNIARIRGLIRTSLKSKTEIILISGAKNANYLMSHTQMREIGKFLGMNDASAADAISRLGEDLDN